MGRKKKFVVGTIYECSRCGHKWPAQKENPMKCPKCSSRRWAK